MQVPTPGAATAAESEALGARRVPPADVAACLTLLARSLQKTTAYPAGHPLLASEVDALVQGLGRFLGTRGSLALGVARDRLVLEDAITTDPTSPLMRSFAESLHHHQIGAMRFDLGVTATAISSFLCALSADSRHSGPLGAGPTAALRQWPHIEVMPAAIDALEIAEAMTEGGRAEHLWVDLACAALRRNRDEIGPNTKLVDLVRALRANLGDAEYDRAVVEALARVGQELASRGAVHTPVAQQLGDLVEDVGDDALGTLLDLGADAEGRRALVLDLGRVLPVGSILTLTRAAAAASNEKISEAAVRLLEKMADSAELQKDAGGRAAEAALRSACRDVARRWSPADPTPTRYRQLLHYLSRADRSGEADPDALGWTDAMRLVGVSLESGVAGASILEAVNELLRLGRLDELIDALDAAPSEDAARRIQAHIVEPDRLKALLCTKTSRRALERLLEWTDRSNAAALLDALEAAEGKPARRYILARLASMGEAVAPALIERLESGPWHVERNMLNVLGEIENLPETFLPLPWLEHPDPRVRDEAIRVALRVPETRLRAITAALADGGSRIVSIALAAASDDVSRELVPVLTRFLDETEAEPAGRAQAIRVLGDTEAPGARDWIIRYLQAGRRWWRRGSLGPRTPELLAAIGALRKHWPDDPETQRVLRAAGQPEPAGPRGHSTSPAMRP